MSEAQGKIIFSSSANDGPALSGATSDWLSTLQLKADDLYGVVGTTNDYTVAITAQSADGLASTTNVLVKVRIDNTPPDFTVALSPVGLIATSRSVPFQLYPERNGTNVTHFAAVPLFAPRLNALKLPVGTTPVKVGDTFDYTAPNFPVSLQPIP